MVTSEIPAAPPPRPKLFLLHGPTCTKELKIESLRIRAAVVMSSAPTNNTSLPDDIVLDEHQLSQHLQDRDDEIRPVRPKLRRSSMSSTGSSRSRSTSSRSSSRSFRRKIIVSDKRRLLITIMRYVISQKEYSFVRRKALLKGPLAVSKSTPTRAEFDAVARTLDDFVPASFRAGVRMFVLGNVLLNLFNYSVGRLRSQRKGTAYVCCRGTSPVHSTTRRVIVALPGRFPIASIRPREVETPLRCGPIEMLGSADRLCWHFVVPKPS